MTTQSATSLRKFRLTITACAVLAALLVIGRSASLLAQSADDPPAAEKKSDSKTCGSPDQAKSDETTKSDVEESSTVEKADKKPAKSADDPEPRREPSQTEILRELQRQSRKEMKTPIKTGVPGETPKKVELPPGNAIAPLQDKLLPDGSRIVDRPGRLTRDGDSFLYSFESRGEGLADRPIRLLPNRLLENMEMYSENGQKPIVFIVSGEITEYHGANYLLVQKLLVRPDTGNLR